MGVLFVSCLPSDRPCARHLQLEDALGASERNRFGDASASRIAFHSDVCSVYPFAEQDD